MKTEIEIADDVLQSHRSSVDMAAMDEIWAKPPIAAAWKVDGPGCWFEEFDGTLTWREG